MDVKFPKIYEEYVKRPRRINIFEGGRGGAKSHTVSEDNLIKGCANRIRVLNTREIQKSIKESVHQLYSDKITQKLYPYEVLNTEIRCPMTGTEFFFHGLQDKTALNLKSFEGADICWVEEAQGISKKSNDILVPTIRKQGSRLVYTMNREEEDDPVYKEFLDGVSLPYISPGVRGNGEILHIHVNYYDNKFCPEVLIKQAEACKAKAERTGDWSDYNHIWLGMPVSRKGKIFKDFRVEDFSDIEGSFNCLRGGLDWGFADDPLAYVRMHFDRKRKRLYIIDELYLYGHTNDKSFPLVQEKAGIEKIIADSSEPKSIADAQSFGLYMSGAKKGPGSVEHGIKFIQSLEVIIHPRCVNAFMEFKKYMYKVDKNNNILPEPIDKFNHIIDAIRYALENDSLDERGGSFFA